MFSLSKLFNKRHVVSVDRDLLLDTVKPFLKNAAEYTNKDIADGWDEAVEWLRIGFHYESDKGTNYQAMRRALILITRQIQNAPEGETIDIRKEDLAMLRSCYFQLEQAAQYLVLQEERAAVAPQKTVQTRSGHSLIVPPKEIFNKPNSDYKQAAQAVRDFSKNLDTLFGVHRFKEVHHHSAISYSKQHPK